MNNTRRHAVSPRRLNSRLNVSACRTHPARTATENVTGGFITVNAAEGWTSSQDRSGGCRGTAAINDAIRSAARHSGAISIDALLRETCISQIIDICRTIRGAKILTVCRDHDASFTTHINENGKIGVDPTYTRKLRSELNLALQHGGTFIIRQYLPIKTQKINSRGEMQWVPWKSIYAFNLGNNRFEAVPIEQLKYANSMSPDGKSAAKEQRVTFCEYRISGERRAE